MRWFIPYAPQPNVAYYELGDDDRVWRHSHAGLIVEVVLVGSKSQGIPASNVADGWLDLGLWLETTEKPS